MKLSSNQIFLVIMLLIEIAIISCRSENMGENQGDTPFMLSKKHSAQIIDNLTNVSVLNYFNAKYFGDTIGGRRLFEDLNNRCDIKNGKGGYYGQFTEINKLESTIDKVHYVYEYTYDCGSIRYLFSYIIFKKENTYQLFHFKIEKASKDNDIVKEIQKSKKQLPG